MTKLRRITMRHEQLIQQIAREEGREPRNVVDLLLDRGLAARSLGDWPTIPREHQHRAK
jgi:hypothetical protein